MGASAQPCLGTENVTDSLHTQASRDAQNALYVATERVRSGRHSKSLLLIGETKAHEAILRDLHRSTLKSGSLALWLEGFQSTSLPALLIPQIHQALLALSTMDSGNELAELGLRALAGFAKGLRAKYPDITCDVAEVPSPGIADNGDLDHDLAALLESTGHAATAAGAALVVFVNTSPSVPDEELSALLGALHRCAQQALPVLFVVAGSTTLSASIGRAKPYGERLFDVLHLN